VHNRGFSPQPLMLLYHCNFGFPLLGPGARLVGPIAKSEARDEEARKDRGLEECLSFPEPVQESREKVFFHTLAAESDGSTFIALLNRDTGEGQPLGIVLRWNQKELPTFTEWKMPCRGFYVVGLEPGTMMPIGRGTLREKGALPLLHGQGSAEVTLDFAVLDTLEQFEELEKRARKLAGK
jgi:hypothetical protein